MLAAVADYLPHRCRPTDPAGLLRNLRQRPDGRWYWHWDPAFLRHRNLADRSSLSDEHARLTAAARNIRVPTLLARGDRSDVVTGESVAKLRRLIRHAQVVDVPGAGHMVAGDANDLFNEAVIGFIGASRDGELFTRQPAAAVKEPSGRTNRACRATSRPPRK